MINNSYKCINKSNRYNWFSKAKLSTTILILLVEFEQVRLKEDNCKILKY